MGKTIEQLRHTLQELVRQHGTLHPRVIAESQMLDKLIVQHMTCSPRRQRKAPMGMSPEEIRELLESIFSLHQELEQLRRTASVSDPRVLNKSRKLDKMLLTYIRR